MDIIIHPGLHKTGTCFLQREVFSKSKNIRVIRNFLLTTDISNDSKVLISNESLCGPEGMVGANVLSRYVIAKRLKALFPDARIIIGTRNPEARKKSLYKEYIKLGGSLSLDDWYEVIDKRFITDDHQYVSFFRELFEHVHVYSMENLLNHNKETVKAIYDFMGEPVPHYEFKKVNVGMTSSQLKTIATLNKLYFNRHPFIRGWFKKSIRIIRDGRNGLDISRSK